ncbi:hypothetical protein DTO207G8_170 [Paecilomyces variotii]|nr:hypothetical protein DTO169E5_3207 [Paecilomyces variotii]KAJ9261020.1 hypothetical protein DTO207G8_170 [Paecilomyces variotii]KAJ9389485.1 hypothetical protein DTO063F5_1978 [Paecilomyces variotii]
MSRATAAADPVPLRKGRFNPGLVSKKIPGSLQRFGTSTGQRTRVKKGLLINVDPAPLNGALTHGHLALFSPLFPPLTHTIPSSTPLRRRLSPQDSSPSLDTCRPLSPDKDLSQILQYQNHQELS